MARSRGTKPFQDKRRGDGKWYVRWTQHNGRRRSQSFDTEAEAQLALQRHELEVTEIRLGVKQPLIAPNKKCGELFDYWLEHYAPSKRTESDMQNIVKVHLRPEFGEVPLRALNPRMIDRFTANRAHLSHKTIGNHLTLLRTMLGVAKEHGWIPEVPKIRKPHAPVVDHGDDDLDDEDYRFLKTDHEIARFLSAAKDAGEHVFAFYATAIYTGMRAGELAALTWANVDLVARQIRVRRSFRRQPKTKSSRRTIPIFDPLLIVLREWRLKCPGDFVFPNKRGKMHIQSARIFKQTFHAVLGAAKFPKVTINGEPRNYIRFHDLRHSFASHWMMRGGSLYKLRDLMGHTTIKMTERYAHLAPDSFNDDLGRFGDRAPAAVAENVIRLTGQI